MNALRWIIAVVLFGAIAFALLRDETSREPHANRSQPTLKGDTVKSPSEMLARLEASGHADLAAEFKAQVQPCVHLVTGTQVAGKRIAIKVGGFPDLPDASMWPTHDGKHLAFLMQINLEEVHALLPESGLPEKGMLFFFCDAGEPPWGYDPKHKGRSRVVYIEEVSKPAAPLEFPKDLPKEGRFKEHPLTGKAAESLPNPIDLPAYAKLNDADQETLFDWYESVKDSTGPLHQVAGYPCQIQGEMQLECQLASNGVDCGDEDGGENDPRAKALASGANDWRLLLQIDSDDAAGMMWGDAGMLYFWIKEDDLNNRRFENAWMILQCY